MTPCFRSIVAAIAATALGGCSLVSAMPTETLVPLVAQGGPVGTSAPAPVVMAAARDLSGLDPYPTMHVLLAASGVLDEIGDRDVTVLAPSESAFRAFAVSDPFGLMGDPSALAPILRRHVLLGHFDAATLGTAGTVTTIAGEQLTVWRNGGMVLVNEIGLTLAAPEGDVAAPTVASVVVLGVDGLLLMPEGTG